MPRMSCMQVTILPVTLFAQNCSIIRDSGSNAAAIIDPGGDIEKILEVVANQGLAPERILLTHAHLDHVGGAAALAGELGVPIEGPHRADESWVARLPEQGRMFGFPFVSAFTPQRWLDQGDTVRVGAETLEVLHCPGHTPGHVVYFHRPGKIAFVGDVLFAGSIGRTDLPGGDYDTLISSIRERLWPLGDDVTFVPGHGPNSTFGAERKTNPFVADR